MSTNRVPAPSATARQRILLLVTVAALVAAWRERAFARNRAKFGAVEAPDASA